MIRSFESSPPPCGSHLMERAKGRGHEDECARSATLFAARIAPNDRKVQPYVHYVAGGTFNGEAISKK